MFIAMINGEMVFKKLCLIEEKYPEYFEWKGKRIFSYIYINWEPFRVHVAENIPDDIKKEINDIPVLLESPGFKRSA